MYINKKIYQIEGFVEVKINLDDSEIRHILFGLSEMTESNVQKSYQILKKLSKEVEKNTIPNF